MYIYMKEGQEMLFKFFKREAVFLCLMSYSIIFWISVVMLFMSIIG